ncbi:MAG: zinc dependent phospholipase C family protein [Gemmatimonadota bacterium]
MPCATVHMLLAREVMTGWNDDPRAAPVRLDTPQMRGAFLHGAMAPDMGFVPGTERLFSEAVHYLRPADLTRELLARARSKEEEAFGWGWATHVVGDVRIHPLVGRAVGERLFGDRELRVDATFDEETHVSLEVGLDIALLRGERNVPPPATGVFLRNPGGASPLREALTATYGVEWDEQRIVEDHGRAARMTRWWPRALALLPLRPPAGEPRIVSKALQRGLRRGTAMRGFFAPETPQGWFLEAVQREIAEFRERFQSLVRSGLLEMENLNLETGEPTGAGRGHPATDAVDLKLRESAREVGAPPAG